MWLGYFLDAAVTLLIRESVRLGNPLEDAAEHYAPWQRGAASDPADRDKDEPDADEVVRVDPAALRTPQARAARNAAAFAQLEMMMSGVKR